MSIFETGGGGGGNWHFQSAVHVRESARAPRFIIRIKRNSDRAGVRARNHRDGFEFKTSRPEKRDRRGGGKRQLKKIIVIIEMYKQSNAGVLLSYALGRGLECNVPVLVSVH